MSTESSLQKHVNKACTRHGILCYKFSSPARRGVPDLILVGFDGRVAFMELKSPTGKGKISKLQHAELKKLSRKGAEVYVVDNKDDADKIITSIGLERRPRRRDNPSLRAFEYFSHC